MDQTSERNFKAIQQAVNIMEGRLQAQEVRVGQLHSMMAEQTAILTKLQQQVDVMRAESAGHGPTAR